MNYATLRTINLLIMYDTFNNQSGTDADKQTCRFLSALKQDLNVFIKYTTNMYSAILKGHDQNLDFKSFKANMERTWTNEGTEQDGKDILYTYGEKYFHPFNTLVYSGLLKFLLILIRKQETLCMRL